MRTIIMLNQNVKGIYYVGLYEKVTPQNEGWLAMDA